MDIRLRRIISGIQGYLWTFGFVWLAGLVFFVRWGYEDSFLLLNALNHPLLDLFLPHFTHLGDGLLVSGIFALIMVRRDKALIICLSITLFFILVFTTLGKEWLFTGWSRPIIAFQGGPPIHYITIAGERWKSFPSGHSAVAASVFMFISFSGRSSWKFTWGLIWGLLAVLACYSRLYIGVHFLGDILAGGALGLIVGIGTIMAVYDRLYVYFVTMSSTQNKRWYYGMTWLIAILWVVNTWQLIQLYMS